MAASRLLAVNQSSGAERLPAAGDRRTGDRGHQPVRRAGHRVAALLGALVITSISNGMDLLGLETSIKFIVTGAVLLLAVIIDAIARSQRQAAGRV